jgi:hypothetical protein
MLGFAALNANVSKIPAGSLLNLEINNIFDNQLEY